MPIEVGGALTGRVGRYSLGVLNIESDDERPSAPPRRTFPWCRVKRDILRRSSIGVIFTGAIGGDSAAPARNQVYGVDGTFAFFDNLAINTYWARTQTPMA